MGLVDKIEQDSSTIDVLSKDPILKNTFNMRSGSLPMIKMNNDTEILPKSYDTVNQSGMSLATKLGKIEYYRPKFLCKPNIKYNLPSYNHSDSRIFQEPDQKQSLNLGQMRRVGKGIDLSEVLNSSYSPEKDISKVNNSIIEKTARKDSYIDTTAISLLTKRNINESQSQNFMKYYDHDAVSLLYKSNKNK